MPKCYMRIDKFKTYAALNAAMNHNFRLETVDNADPNRQHLNEELVKMPAGETYNDAYRRMIESSPVYQNNVRPRRDAVKAVEVLTSYTSCSPSEAPDIDAWKRENVAWLQETFGKENVVSVVLHMDEHMPHIHAVVIPMKDGRLSYSSFVDGPASVRAMLDSYSDRMEPLGLERGARGSRAKHQSIRRFYRELNEAESKQLPGVIEGESAQDYRKRAQVVHAQANVAYLHNVKRLQQAADRAQGVALQERLDFAGKELDIERRLAAVEKAEASLRDESSKVDRMNELIYAVKHNLPSPEEAQHFMAQMVRMGKLGRRQMEIDGVEVNSSQDRGVADDVLTHKE